MNSESPSTSTVSRPPFTWWGFFGVFALQFAGTAALLFVVRGLGWAPASAGLASPLLYAVTTIFFLLMLLGVYLFAARRSGWAALGVRPAPAWAFMLAPVLLLTGLLLAASINLFITLALGREFENPQIAAITGGRPLTPLELVAVLVLVAGLVPLAEELLFRGMLYGLLRRRFGATVTILASAAIFAVLHLIPIIFPALFILGVLLALLRTWSKSVWPCIVLHALQNAFALLAINMLLAAGATA